MGHHRTSAGRAGHASLALLAASLLCLAFASSAWAATEHAFDPVRSLTGDTSVSPQDEVPDPGESHPGRFKNPCGTATDRHGYVYVVSSNPDFTQSGEGRVDIFDPQGHYVTSFKVEAETCGIAVDSEGNIYVIEVITGGGDMALFTPSAFPPVPSATYTEAAEPVVTEGKPKGVAVNPLDDHVYVATSQFVVEYDSAANGSGVLDNTIGFGYGTGPVGGYHGVDVYGANGDVYALGGAQDGSEPFKSALYVFDGTDGHLKVKIDGSDEDAFKNDRTPENGFGISAGRGAVAVDQENGDVYVGDIAGGHDAVDQFDAEGNFVGQLKHSFEQATPYDDVAVDNPAPGQLGYDSPNAGYVYVTSANGSFGSNVHLYAFSPPASLPPAVRGQRATQITAGEAVLRAEVNPGNLPTDYHLEYTTQADWEAEGYAGATSVPVPDAGPLEGGAFLAASRPISGLQPDTRYRFRLVATNEECPTTPTMGEGTPCGEGEDASFSTYLPEAGLPDGRGYELVTPPETGGRIPTGSAFGILGGSATPLASPDGESLLFAVEGGALPGLPASGFLDSYESRREPSGEWSTSFAGLNGAQAEKSFPEGAPASHGFTLHNINGSNGSLATGAVEGAFYLRLRDGTVEPVGLGSLGVDTRAVASAASEDGSRLFLATGYGLAEAVQLEPNAPPDGTRAIYERAPGGGPTHVVSLLPGDATPAPGENAVFRGASADGTAVAFKIGETLYLRLDGEETFSIASGGARFGGLSGDGRRLVYLVPNEAEPLLAGSTEIPQGEIHVFDPAGGGDATIGSGDEAVLVNVSADGSHVYFTAPQQLDGAKGTPGEDNLYLWDGSGVRFIATVEHGDVLGEGAAGGLGLWVPRVLAARQNGEFAGPASEPSRTTPGGSAFLFESTAPLDPAYDNEGHREIYRYAAASGELICVSCNPTGTAPTSDASLMSRPSEEAYVSLPPVNAIAAIPNLSEDGTRAFFQSEERLALADHDSFADVYEWQAQGTDGCPRARGCVRLISSGQSAGEEYLYGASADGHDVFFWSGEQLVARDTGGSPSIYDARIGGGAPEAASRRDPCLGEACQPVVSAPDADIPSSASFHGAGNPAGGGKSSCGAAARAARRKAARVSRVRRKARLLRHRNRRRAQRLGRRAQRLAKGARRANRAAKRCRVRANRGRTR